MTHKVLYLMPLSALLLVFLLLNSGTLESQKANFPQFSGTPLVRKRFVTDLFRCSSGNPKGEGRHGAGPNLVTCSEAKERTQSSNLSTSI